jgi:hypothetical protein
MNKLAKLDPVTGPIPRERFAEIVNAPHGKACEMILKYDPQWGRADGEKFDWKVRVERSGTDEGTAIVKAATEQEAMDAAEELSESEIDWDYDCGDFAAISAEPHKERP